MTYGRERGKRAATLTLPRRNAKVLPNVVVHPPTAGLAAVTQPTLGVDSKATPSAALRGLADGVRGVWETMKRLDPLLATASILALVLWLVVCRGANAPGYTWLYPLHAFRRTVLRSGFPIVMVTALLLGTLSRLSSSERRALPRKLLLGIRGVLRDRRALRRCPAPAAAGVFVALALGTVSKEYRWWDIGVIGLIAAAWAATGTAQARLRRSLLDGTRVIALFVLCSFIFTVVKAHLFRLTLAQDQRIIDWETLLFGEPLHRPVTRWVSSHPLAVEVLDDVYFRFFDHMTAGAVFLAGARRYAERNRLWAAIGVCYLIGGLSYYLLPGYGPAFYEASSYAFLDGAESFSYRVQTALKLQTEVFVAGGATPLISYGYIACMPSLHITQELILLYYSRFFRPFLVMSLGLALGTVGAILGLGWHYALDIVGGALLAAVVLVIVESARGRLMRELPMPAVPRFARPLRWQWLACFGLVALVHLPAIHLLPIWDDIGLLFASPGPYGQRSWQSLEILGVLLGGAPIPQVMDPMHLPGVRPVAQAVRWVMEQFLTYGEPASRIGAMALLAALGISLIELLRRMGLRRNLAVLWTLPVLAHPLAAELVRRIAVHDVLIGTLVLFVAWAVVVRACAPAARVMAIALGTVFAGACHETLVLPALILVLASQPGSAARPLSALGALGAYLTGVGLWGCWLTPSGALDSLVVGVSWSAVPGRVLALGGRAVELVVAPVDLSIQSSLIGPKWLGFILIAALLGCLSLARGSRLDATSHRLLRVGATYALLVVASFAVLGSKGTGVPDHFAFGVALGLMFLGAGLARLVVANGRIEARPGSRKWAWMSAAAATAAAALLSLARYGDSRDPSALTGSMMEQRPDDPQSWLAHGRFLVESGRVEEGGQLCRRFAEAYPASRDADGCRAFAAMKAGQPGSARAYLSGIEQIQSHDSLVRVARAGLLQQSGNTRELAMAVEEWSRTYPDAWDVLSARSALSRMRGEGPAPLPDEGAAFGSGISVGH